MEQLDLVYNTLTKLEQNYARSKKSRTEYITEKLGGDINVGSFLILHALAKETLTEQGDVEKLSTVRNILAQIKVHQDELDSLRSFEFSKEADSLTVLLEAMDAAEAKGTRISAVNQRDMWKSPNHPAHFSVNRHMSRVVAFNGAPYVYCYSKAISALVSGLSGQRFEPGDIVRCRLGERYEKVDAPDCWVDG